MSRKRVHQILARLKCVKRMSVKQRQKFLKSCDKDFIHCICECVKNLLKGRVPLKSNQFKALSRHKQSLRTLSLKKTSLAKRRKILQSGGFFHMLMPALFSGISGLVTQLIKNAGSQTYGSN